MEKVKMDAWAEKKLIPVKPFKKWQDVDLEQASLQSSGSLISQIQIGGMYRDKEDFETKYYDVKVTLMQGRKKKVREGQRKLTAEYALGLHSFRILGYKFYLDIKYDQFNSLGKDEFTLIKFENYTTKEVDAIKADNIPTTKAIEPVPVKADTMPSVIRHEKYEQIKACMEQSIPVYLSGPAGSGKNYAVEQIADDMGVSFYFANAVQQEYKLTGFIDAGGRYHVTEFYKAAVEGEPCVFFLDEMDGSIPEVLILLNAAIANGYFEFPVGRLDVSHIMFVAAGNTLGSGADELYSGRMELDQATLDRFIIIEFNYDKRVERKLAGGNMDLLNFVYELRRQAALFGIRTTFSYRCIISATKLMGKLELTEIIKIAIVKGLDKDTLKTFNAMQFKGEYQSAFQKVAS